MPDDECQHQHRRAECVVCTEVAKAAREWLVKNRGFDCFLKITDGVVVAQAEFAAEWAERVTQQLRMENLGLRKRLHFVETHNQYFDRCESAFCHPTAADNPSIGYEAGHKNYRDDLRERAESAERELAAARKALAEIDARTVGAIRLTEESLRQINGIARAALSPPATQPELCGEYVIDLIAGASFYGCALPKGHPEKGHRARGICVKHGPFLGEVGAVPRCPKWPNCTQIHATQPKEETPHE